MIKYKDVKDNCYYLGAMGVECFVVSTNSYSGTGAAQPTITLTFYMQYFRKRQWDTVPVSLSAYPDDNLVWSEVVNPMVRHPLDPSCVAQASSGSTPTAPVSSCNNPISVPQGTGIPVVSSFNVPMTTYPSIIMCNSAIILNKNTDVPPVPAKCCCGAASVGSNFHSSWCTIK